MLAYLFNAVLRLQSWSQHLRVAEIILVLKPGKNPYRPISLLSTVSKLLGKLILHRIRPSLDEIPHHQFAFRHSQSAIQQWHRIAHTISRSFDPSVFLDKSQASDKVWHDGPLYKIKPTLPTYFRLIRCYINGRQFRTKVNGEIANVFPVKSGVPQSSVLGPVLYYYIYQTYRRQLIQ
jgi:hypothetical protein